MTAQALAQVAATLATSPAQVEAPKGKNAGTKGKPAAKTAAETKGKNKPAAKPAKPAAKAIPYGIHNGSRPAAGRMLFAFTHAWLSLSGMAAGKGYSRAEATKVAGSTAISYHTGNGNMADKGGVLTLTAKGQNFFKARAVDSKMAGAYVAALKTGKPQDGIIPKNADEFVKV